MSDLDLLDKLLVYDYETAPSTGGSYKVGSLSNIRYNDLVEILGSPTITDPSGDDKVQKEWVVEFEDKIFTIYDWKTYSVFETMNTLETWSIGGNSYSGGLEQYIYKLKNEIKLPF